MTMVDVFISYKREECEKARLLAVALRSRGWSVWWDPEVRAGERFHDVIEAAIKSATCVIVLWSKLSVTSKYVKDEADYALELQKLVPVALDEAQLPLRFKGLNTIPLHKWDGSASSPALQELMSEVIRRVPPQSRASVGASERPVLSVRVALSSNLTAPLKRQLLREHASKLQLRTNFPPEVLHVYPTMLEMGLQWGDHSSDWSFFVGTDRSVEYTVIVNDGATFMEGGPPTKPGPERPGISGLRCLVVPQGILRFWTAAFSDLETVSGKITLRIEHTLGRYLSFNGLDTRLETRYPQVWNYTFWNHDGVKCSVSAIEESLDITSSLTEERIVNATADIFAGIASFFSFNTADSSSAHPLKRIKELVGKLG